VPWIGAGVSIESHIPGAQTICETLAKEFIARIQLERTEFRKEPPLSNEQSQALLTDEFEWHDVSARYARCIKRVYSGLPDRVDFFRRLVAGRSPSFAHYATALLMQSKIFGLDCVTTNFDKLLERAFHDIGAMECQPIRNERELDFHQPNDDKAFCIKIHGDYDTHNLLNTEEETVLVEKAVADYVEQILRNRGLLVIGSAGFEKSIHTFFDRLTKHDKSKRILHYGLLWGVFVGDHANEPTEEVRRRVQAGEVSKEIVKVMQRNYSRDAQFAFFPVVSAGEFLRRLIVHVGDRELFGAAAPFFDHEMRIRNIFHREGLTDHAYKQHIDRLRAAQKRLERASGPSRPVWAFREQPVPGAPTRVSLLYGSLGDTRLLTEGRMSLKRAAVVSPDDTFISVGGGTALALARAAGERAILHDVSKLAPISRGQVAVTSAGKLPVEYILHGASVELLEDKIDWSEESIYLTTQNALLSAMALGVQVLFTPLLAAGAGRAPPTRSVYQILRAIFDLDRYGDPAEISANPLRVNIVVFEESELPRHVYEAEYEGLRRARLATGLAGQSSGRP
jgi:O-acetyl-ADP-ribose deacetylase (regulator of RNase III)